MQMNKLIRECFTPAGTDLSCPSYWPQASKTDTINRSLRGLDVQIKLLICIIGPSGKYIGYHLWYQDAIRSQMTRKSVPERLTECTNYLAPTDDETCPDKIFLQNHRSYATWPTGTCMMTLPPPVVHFFPTVPSIKQNPKERTFNSCMLMD
jgi:hypothetical protein